jgi:VIT1/CCC1 family predicted Fe2+/Mn2+ transporter
MARGEKLENVLYLRNFIFGVDDSLVSTVGLLSGVASAGVPKSTVFLTGMVLIFVEAFSMATGSFLSEHSAEELERRSGVTIAGALIASVIMFLSYFLSGFIPLFPYLIFEKAEAFWVSNVLAGHIGNTLK